MNHPDGMLKYLQSCNTQFWRSIFQAETDYLHRQLNGCLDILSVGCGPAIIESSLTERGFHVTGIDISKETVVGCPVGGRRFGAYILIEGEGETAMKIAIPMAGGRLCMHFGHCEQFALVDVDETARKPVNTTLVTPPAHEPGLLPRWLHEQGATVIIAGGMGQRAQMLFAENGIEVIVGAPADTAESLAAAYLSGTLASGQNTCDH